MTAPRLITRAISARRINYGRSIGDLRRVLSHLRRVSRRR